MIATLRNLMHPAKKTRIKNRWSPQLESLEARQLLAADLIFNTTEFDHDNDANTPDEPISFSVDVFDWANGNALITNFDGISKDGETGELLYQARLAQFVDEDNPVTADGGLDADYEVTAVLRATVGMNADGNLTLYAPQDASSFGLEIYHDDLPGGVYGGSGVKADNLSGVGFDDGQLILKAEILDIRNSQLVVSKPPLVTTFDQASGANDYPDIQTAFVVGGFDVDIRPTFVNTEHLDVRYGGPLMAMDLDQTVMDFNISAPFTQTNPSQTFFNTVPGTQPEYDPVIDTTAPKINGDIDRGAEDLQVEADAAVAFPLRKGSIHGFKFEDILKDGTYDPERDGDVPMAGVRFDLWTDNDRDGKIEDGDTPVDGMTVHSDENGEFWFEPVEPGYYVIRETSSTAGVGGEVAPSTHTEYGIFVCAGEEHVWREGAADFGAVLGRHLYYDNSKWDDNDSFADTTEELNENDDAIAPDVSAYIAGSGPATFNNISSYSEGIVGIAVDLLNGGLHNPITVSDFKFRVGNDNHPSLWGAAPLPISVKQEIGAGVGGSTRVYIEWAIGDIRNQWLQVRVRANANTRLLTDDVHFWGNFVGEAGNQQGPPFQINVDGTDASAVYSNLAEGVGILNDWDFTRDGRVDGTDASAVFNNLAEDYVTLDLDQEDIKPLRRWHKAIDEQPADENLIFGNFVEGSIHGFKFNDYDANGIYDPGIDTPMAGIPFDLYMTDANGLNREKIATQETDHAGEFWFEGLMPGHYVVEENLDDVWPDVMPSPGNLATGEFANNVIQIKSGQEYVWKKDLLTDGINPTHDLPEGSLRDEVDPPEGNLNPNLIWGNFIKGSIHGFKFEDVNGDGSFNEGDRPWDDITFDLYYFNPETEEWQILDTSVTGGMEGKPGEFWFEDLLPGQYQLWERPSYMMLDDLEGSTDTEYLGPDGQLHPASNSMYINTRQVKQDLWVGSGEELVWEPGAAMLPDGALQKEVMHRSWPPFEGSEELVFGDYIPGSIHGFKCEDIDADGSCEEGDVDDPGFPNVPIFLDRWDSSEDKYVHVDTTLTMTDNPSTDKDEAGEYWFENLRPGRYRVREAVNPVGVVTTKDNATLVGLPDQGELLDENGEVAFPLDNVMESNENTIELTIESREEYVWQKGAGHFERFCFTDSPGLIEVNGDVTHQLCAGDMATHDVSVDISMPDNAYTVTEIEFDRDGAKDGGPAQWTSGTHTFNLPNGLSFEGKVTAGKIRTWSMIDPQAETLNSSWDDGTVVTATTISGPGAGAKFAVTVDGNGDPVLTLVDPGSDYSSSSVIRIPFTTVDDDGDPLGFFSNDNINISVDSVESMFDDLWLPGGDPGDDNADLYGPDGNVLTGGKGFMPGDMFTVTPPGSIVGDILTLVDGDAGASGIQPTGQGTGYGVPGLPTPTFTYSGIADTSGEGTQAAVFDVVVDTDPNSANFEQVVEVILKSPGKGYSPGDKVTLPGIFLGAGNDDDVEITVGTVGNDRVMVKVVDVGNTEIKVTLNNDMDMWGQIDPSSDLQDKIDALTGGNPSQTVTFDPLKLTGAGYDDLLSFYVTTMLGDTVDESDGTTTYAGTATGYDGVATVDYTGDIDVDLQVPSKDVNGKEGHTAEGNGSSRTTFTIAINNGTIKREVVVGEDLIFENYVKGSIHGRKFHDRNLDGTFNDGDEPFPGIEFSLVDANGNLVNPDITFGAGEPGNALAPTTQYEFVNQGPGTSSGDVAWIDAGQYASTTVTEGKSSTLSLVAFTPQDVGVAFDRMLLSDDSNATLKFYVDDVEKATFTGKDSTWQTYWNDGNSDGEWGYHKYTWVFSYADNGNDKENESATAMIDNIRFTALTNANGEYWMEDIKPGDYTVRERLDLAGTFDGEVMPSFMNVSQWPVDATATTEFTGDPGTSDDDMLASDTHNTDDDGNNVEPDGQGWAPFGVLGNSQSEDHHENQMITLHFPKAVYVSAIDIYELLPDGGDSNVVGIQVNSIDPDSHVDGGLVDFPLDVSSSLGGDATRYQPHSMPPFLSNTVKITVADNQWGDFEKIDTVRLHGMMKTKTELDVTVDSGKELVWQDGAAMLPTSDTGNAGGTLREESLVSELDFANLIKGSIHAFKFEDLNGDGQYTPDVDFDPNKDEVQGDRPWAGFNFELYTRNYLTGKMDVLLDTATSNSNGEVWFTGLKPLQDYQVVEAGPEASPTGGDVIDSSTSNKSSIFNVGSGQEIVWEEGRAMYDLDPQSNPTNTPVPKPQYEQQDSSLLFGNYMEGSLHGFKFEDIDGDGIYDQGSETGWGGVRFIIEGVGWTQLDEPIIAETDPHGEFWVQNLRPGWYQITEDLTNWPDAMPSPGHEASRYFLVLSGKELVWTDGAAMLPSTSAREEMPAVAYEQPSLSAPLAAPANGLVFGNFIKGSIHGVKCDDANGDGECDFTSNVVIVLDASQTMLAPAGYVVGTDADPNNDDDDLNGDGLFNTKLDAEIAALMLLNDELQTLDAANVNTDYLVTVIELSNNTASTVVSDVSPGAAVDSALTGVGTGVGSTNIQSGVNLAFNELAGEKPHVSNVIFVSDGNVTDPPFSVDTSNLLTRADNLMSFGVGPDAAVAAGSALNMIDSDVTSLETKAALQTAVKDAWKDGEFNGPEMPLAGVQFDLYLNGGFHSSEVTDSTGEFWFTELRPGSYELIERLDLFENGIWASSHGGNGVDSDGNPLWSKFISSREEYAWATGQADLGPGTEKVEIVDNDLNFANYIPGSIHAVKFEDLNGDGVKQENEPWFSGIPFKLTGPGDFEKTVNSAFLTGQVNFTGLRPGHYTLTEIQPDPSVVPTTPTSISFVVESGEEYVWDADLLDLPECTAGPTAPNGQGSVHCYIDVGEDLYFGNTILGSIHGFKFEDYNGDGQYNNVRTPSGDDLVDNIDNDGDGFVNEFIDALPDRPGHQAQEDSPWANFPFEITGDRDGDGDVETWTVFTNSDGQFDVTGLFPGDYLIDEGSVPGVVSTYDGDLPPGDGSLPVTVSVGSGRELVWEDGAADLQGHPFQQEELETGLIFGNAYAASVHGCVFLDNDGDGIREAGENLLADVKVEIYNASGDLVASDTTDFDGYYDFTGLKPGGYRIKVDGASIPGGTISNPNVADSNPYVAGSGFGIFVGSREELVHEPGRANLPPGSPLHEVLILSTNAGNDDIVIGVQPNLGGTNPAVAASLDGQHESFDAPQDQAVDRVLEALEVERRANLEMLSVSRPEVWVDHDGGSDSDNHDVDDVWASLDNDEDLGIFLS